MAEMDYIRISDEPIISTSYRAGWGSIKVCRLHSWRDKIALYGSRVQWSKGWCFFTLTARYHLSTDIFNHHFVSKRFKMRASFGLFLPLLVLSQLSAAVPTASLDRRLNSTLVRRVRIPNSPLPNVQTVQTIFSIGTPGNPGVCEWCPTSHKMHSFASRGPPPSFSSQDDQVRLLLSIGWR